MIRLVWRRRNEVLLTLLTWSDQSYVMSVLHSVCTPDNILLSPHYGIYIKWGPFLVGSILNMVHQLYHCLLWLFAMSDVTEGKVLLLYCWFVFANGGCCYMLYLL